ncbi:putative Ig domain-containing protein, partial [Candidatus Pacearchaeota archaeon]|nr:putative Ig domain-containing protein [Candidatus Pacearchaeota archaeon]
NVVVPPVNNLPVITSTPVTQVNEGQNYVYDVNANDADGDTLTYSLTTAPSWLSINSATGLITGTAPQVNADTAFSVTVKVSDGTGFVTQSYTLTVKNVPIVPPPSNGPSGKDGDGERIRTLPLDDFYNAKYLSQFNPPIVLSEEPEAPVKGKISLAGKILLWLFILIILLIILIIIFWLRRM